MAQTPPGWKLPRSEMVMNGSSAVRNTGTPACTTLPTTTSLQEPQVIPVKGTASLALSFLSILRGSAWKNLCGPSICRPITHVRLTEVRVHNDDILGEEGRGLQTAQLFVHENRIRQAASSVGAGLHCMALAVDCK